MITVRGGCRLNRSVHLVRWFVLGACATLAACAGDAATPSEPNEPTVPARLVFVGDTPPLVRVGETFSLSLEVVDLAGDRATDAQGMATLTIANSQCGAQLTGLSAPVTGGRATFSGVSVDHAGFGFVINAAFESVSGATTLFTVFADGMWAEGSWLSTGSMITPRVRPALVRLRSDSVLVVGGDNVNVPGAEVFDPSTGRFSALGPTRHGHINGLSATLLGDGSVLILGGAAGDRAELFTPDDHRFTDLDPPTFDRQNHAAELLADGRVVILGGASRDTGESESHSAVEFYDPASRSFVLGPNMPFSRSSLATAVLPNGDVLIAGGTEVTMNVGNRRRTAALFDPEAGTYSSLPNSIGYYRDALTLADGRVLMGHPFDVARAEVYENGAFTGPFPMAAQHLSGSATLLPDGSVLLAGGFESVSPPVRTTISEVFDPETNSFVETNPMRVARTNHGAVLLADGRVLAVGGTGGSQLAEVFVPPTCFEP